MLPPEKRSGLAVRKSNTTRSDTCRAIDSLSGGIGSPCVSQAVVIRCPSGVSKPESLMIGIQ
jgi:hypothetical protein